IVDDNQVNAKTYRDFLASRGYRISTAYDGAEAVRLAEELQPDLVIMDVQMPVMDGLEATRRIRAADFSKPILALTALTMLGDRERCLDAGADDYLAKPIPLRKLAARIEGFLGSR
ncbi:MAG: response regulator, partial [Myxococcales bacterium]|nr:response regulator [Myxococcales bacterium]